MEGVPVFITLLLTVIVAWGAVFFVWPAAARARFVGLLSELRDDADDAIIEGRLPDVPAVRTFIGKTAYIRDHPGHVSFSLLAAVHMTYEQYGQQIESRAATYADLTPMQRRLMHELDRRLEEILASHIVRGSRFYSMFWCVAKLAGGRKHLADQTRKVVATPRPAQLASEFNRLPDPRAVLHS